MECATGLGNGVGMGKEIFHGLETLIHSEVKFRMIQNAFGDSYT